MHRWLKILNVFWDERKNAKGKSALVEGIRLTLPKVTDRIAMERLRQLSAHEPDVPPYLYKSGRCAIGHAYRQPIVDPDDATDLCHLSEDMWIVKAIAEHLIEFDLGVSKSILGRRTSSP